MTLPNTYVVHYSEVALKGKNRPEFMRSLRRNIKKAVSPLGEVSVELKDGRYLVVTPASPAEVEERLSKVFGVSWFAPAAVVGQDHARIREAILAVAGGGNGTFKVAVRRTDKTFGPGSMEMERRLGEAVVKSTGRKVDLSHPAESLHVDVIRGGALVYSNKSRGPGGLPVGTAGRVMHLFSGGIDSPVAAWLLMKRGCVPVYLHFYLAPTPDYPLGSKVVKLLKVLSSYSGKSTLLLVPFAEYQLATSDAPADLEPSLFRRFMRMTAEALASRFGASAISTGDCLSQAASQTLWNIGTFDKGSSLPILRPLLSYDKDEVIQLARSIGTYELSIEEYKDCCAIITRHPKTRTRDDVIGRYAERYRFGELVEASVKRGTVVSYSPLKDALRTSPIGELKAPLAGEPRARLAPEAGSKI